MDEEIAHTGSPRGTNHQALDGRDLFLFGHPERGAAATGRDHVRVVDLDPGALEPVDEIDRRALDVGQARAVDQQPDPLVLEHLVPGPLLVEGEGILKPAAASAPNPHAQPCRLGNRILRGQELADLLGALICQSDHASASIAMGHALATLSEVSATPEELKTRIEAAIPGARAEVTGDGHHFNAVVASDAFRGLSRIAQHRHVYDDELGDRIHALALQTRPATMEPTP